MAVFALPFILLGLGIMEETVFRTGYVADLYRLIGIYDPLKALLDFLVATYTG